MDMQSAPKLSNAREGWKIVLLTQVCNYPEGVPYQVHRTKYAKFTGYMLECVDLDTLILDIRERGDGRYRVIEYLGYHVNTPENPSMHSIWGIKMRRIKSEYPEYVSRHLASSNLTLEFREPRNCGRGERFEQYMGQENGREWSMQEKTFYNLVAALGLVKRTRYVNPLDSTFDKRIRSYETRVTYEYEAGEKCLKDLPRDVEIY